MSVFKCKMCGGTLEINNNETVAVCEYCGTKQTLPKLDDEKRANLYDRANHFRRNNEFDKAMSIYEQILNEDNTDAEAYWSLVLCRYGIEYVEDPTTRKRIPTVNRAQFTSVFDDDNYKSALKHADGYQKSVYEEEAKAINEIQKGILAISQKEEPFDVFICYKETDNNGRRTHDSVLANDIYHQLTNEGFKVFFSRITLEDKLGSAYEPYIFAALNSAKVMVVLGTKPDYFNAVWVKNEWSRYLALIKNGAKKMLIPAYRDMDPYDLPEEFSHLQAQDMSKLGFMQDLIRGIKKIISTDEPKKQVKETVIVSGANADTAPLLKRAFMFLEDGEWQEADEYCEKVLDRDPENAEAYLGKLMAELEVRTKEDLKDESKPFDELNNYKKAVRFADAALAEELRGYIAFINERNENAHLEDIYNSAKNIMDTAETESACKAAAELFETIREYKDSAALIEECFEKAEVARKDEILAEARSEIARKEAESREKRNKLITTIGMSVLFLIVAFIFIFYGSIIPNIKYNDAVALMDAGKYEDAISAFEVLDGYKDSANQIYNCNIAIYDSKYNEAINLIDTNLIQAYELLIELDDYKDSAEKANSIHSKYETEKIKLSNVGDYVYFGSYEQDNFNYNGKEDIEWLILAKDNEKVLLISKYALDCQIYNTSRTDITWEICSLRKWLNNTFIINAFSTEEQTMIATTAVSADRNPKYNTDPGNATDDKVFLLSINEVNQYFNSGNAKKCEPTEYAMAKLAYGTTNNGYCWWWLRSPSTNLLGAACVQNDGSVHYGGINVNDPNAAVRPAMWISLGE